MGVKIDAINARIDKIEAHLSKCPVKVPELAALYTLELDNTEKAYNKLGRRFDGFKDELSDVKKSVDLILNWIKETRKHGN